MWRPILKGPGCFPRPFMSSVSWPSWSSHTHMLVVQLAKWMGMTILWYTLVIQCHKPTIWDGFCKPFMVTLGPFRLSPSLDICGSMGNPGNHWLVVEPYHSEKWWLFVSWDDDIPHIGKKHVPNHQPDHFWAKPDMNWVYWASMGIMGGMKPCQSYIEADSSQGTSSE